MVLGGSIAYATTPTFAKLVYEGGGDAVGLLATRFPIAALAFAAILALRRRLRAVPWRDPLLALAVGIYFLQALSFFLAVDRIDAGLTVLLLYTYPALVMAAGALFLGEPVSGRLLRVLALVLVGVTLAVGLSGRPDALGVAFGFSAAVLFAAFFLLAKTLMERRGLGSMELTGLVYVGCTPCYLAAGLVVGMQLPDEPGGWAALALTIAIGTIVAAGLLFAGLRRLPANVASLLTTIEPVAGILLAAIVLGEHLGPLQGVGVVMVVVALLQLARPHPVAV
jgi:drug/metabolite transporter (DMT)-like permease